MIPENDCIVQRSDLPDGVRRRLLHVKERELGRTCHKLWTFTNRHGERFLFGSFGRHNDPLVVTVSQFVPMVGWIWPPFHHFAD